MIYDLLAWVSSLIVSLISGWGYLGIFILMLLESALIPVPSEVIMPFSGYLVWLGKFSLWPAVALGAVGNLVGSVIAYFIGFYGGRPLIARSAELAKAEEWFQRYGSLSVFFSRLLPVVRTFISLPAGAAKMPFGKFCLYTLLGSLPWSFALAYAGVISGENWSSLENYFRKFDWLILILIFLTVAWYLYAKFNHRSSR